MHVDHVPCGETANDSEESAVSFLMTKLVPLGLRQKWILLTNVANSVNDRAIPDELDLIAVGTQGVFPIEIKHWGMRYADSFPDKAKHEANKLTEKVKRLASQLNRGGVDAGYLQGRFLLTNSDARDAGNRRVVNGCEFFAKTDWRQLLKIDAVSVLSDADVEKIASILQPRLEIALTGRLRAIGNVRNLELQTPREQRFHRIYRGEHERSRERLLVHLYDLSANSVIDAERQASREFEAIQKLQKLPCVPRIMDSFQEVPEYPGELYFFSLCDPFAPCIREKLHDHTWDVHSRRQFAIRTLIALGEMHEIEAFGVAFVHRRISPDSIRITVNNEPLFTQFDLARTSGTMTVSPNHNQVENDPWIAPEIRKYGFTAADQRTDVFGLCASLLTVFNNSSADEWIEIRLIIEQGVKSDPSARASAQAIIEQLESISTAPLPVAVHIPKAQFWSEGMIVPFNGSQYRIIARLGEGAFGATFKVQEVDDDNEYGEFTAKVLFSSNSSRQVLSAYRAIRTLSIRPGFATIFEVAADFQEDRIAALLQWVSGTVLRDWIGVFSLCEESFAKTPKDVAESWVTSLCEALCPMHNAGFVHGDVSPGNIIESEGEVVLIDYDLLQREGSPAWGQGTTEYSPAERAVGSNIKCSQDLFSVAASLFHVIFDRRPFWFGGHFARERGVNWGGIAREEWGWLPEFIDRATSPTEEMRFLDAADACAWIIKRAPPPSSTNGYDDLSYDEVLNTEARVGATDLSVGMIQDEIQLAVDPLIDDTEVETVLPSDEIKSAQPPFVDDHEPSHIKGDDVSTTEVDSATLEPVKRGENWRERFRQRTHVTRNDEQCKPIGTVRDYWNPSNDLNQIAPSKNSENAETRQFVWGTGLESMRTHPVRLPQDDDSAKISNSPGSIAPISSVTTPCVNSRLSLQNSASRHADASTLRRSSWKSLAAWAKQEGYFNGWERQFLFSLGEQRKSLSEKQLDIAEPLLAFARDRGFED